MADLPVSKEQLKQAITELLDNDLITIEMPLLRSKLETKFNLTNGILSNHQEMISSLITEYTESNLKETMNEKDLDNELFFDELDSYINQNINNNKNKNKNNNPTSNNKNKNKNKSGTIEIMDINYTDRKNSELFDIYCDSNNISYSIMLNLTDITYNQKGHNKYYALQLLKHKHGEQYKFITKWGRVGNKPQTTEEQFDSKRAAIDKFKKKFKSKTKNEFGEKNFVAVKGKYIPIAMGNNNTNNSSEADENEIESDDNMNENGNISEIPTSNLDESVIRILKMIFCKQLQFDTAKSFDFDLNRLPLGQLSKSQIDKGYNILCKINTILCGNNNNNMKQIANLTSKYYTIIPHSFGMRKPPIINRTNRLHKEIELVETLRQMIFTNKILKKRSKTKNPMDVHYNALKCNIKKINKQSMTYIQIEKSIINTHASTHNEYKLNILDVFEVDRNNSKYKYLPVKKQISNCKLLFHGTRLSNFVGILSQGLRIAPPNAPKTGYMFGKGIYFADCASKSANYIHATKAHPFGLLIVCEVALGNEYPIINSKYFDKPPNGYHSVKGVGKNIPDNANDNNICEIDEAKLGLGALIKNNDENVMENGSLLYNEYIVYDIGQVKMKYIVLTKFEFNQ